MRSRSEGVELFVCGGIDYYGCTAGEALEWAEAYELLDQGFTRIGEAIVRAPDLDLFEETGFRLPKRAQTKGLLGTRIALIRLVAETSSPRPAIGDSGELRDLSDAIDRLPEGARHVFVLNAVYGYSHEESSNMLGIAVGTSKAQLHRARRLLAQQLKEQGFEA